MLRYLILIAIGCVLFARHHASAQGGYSPNADWMAGKVGVATHYLPRDLGDVPRYQVEAVADDLKEMGADYFWFTLNQNFGYLNAPNAAFERACGYPAGSHASPRDLPMELSDALARRGIDLVLYTTPSPPGFDKVARRAFGFSEELDKEDITSDQAERWARCLEEWSIRYGTRVKGWWIDGCFLRVGFLDPARRLPEIYSRALRKGNPDVAIAFNPGMMLKPHAERYADYTAGEITRPLGTWCWGRWLEGQQWHLFSYTHLVDGTDETLRYLDGEWVEWLAPVLAHGGAVTLNGICDRPSGRIRPSHRNQLRRIIRAAKGCPSSDPDDVRALEIERTVRAVTDRLRADNVEMHPEDYQKWWYQDYARKEARTPRAELVRWTSAGEVWSDAIDDVLRRTGGCYLPSRSEPYLVDRTIVLPKGGSLYLARWMALHRATLARASGFDGPLVRLAADGCLLEGGLWRTGSSPAVVIENVDGCLVRNLTVESDAGPVVLVRGARRFRLDTVRAAVRKAQDMPLVTTDAACRDGIVRNVFVRGRPQAVVAELEGTGLLIEANDGVVRAKEVVRSVIRP